ncbi:MAG: STAS domain-containing protein [Solirubrobacteraceae bacterium]
MPGSAEPREWQPRPPRYLVVKDSIASGHHTLRLSGELDLASAPGLEDTIEQVCRSRAHAITIDLSRLSFIDSCGLRSILTAKQLCDQSAQQFALVPGRPQVQRVFELSGLADVLPFAA